MEKIPFCLAHFWSLLCAQGKEIIKRLGNEFFQTLLYSVGLLLLQKGKNIYTYIYIGQFVTVLLKLRQEKMGFSWLIWHFENQNKSRKKLGELEILISRNGRNFENSPKN